MWRATALLTGLMAGICVTSVQGQFVADGDVLRGLTAVAVIVEDTGAEAARDGLSESRLQTVTELALRTAGIRIETMDNLRASLSRNPEFRLAHLYVNVNPIKKDGFYAFSISVLLREVMQFVDRSGEAYGATWMRGSVGTIGSNNLRDLADTVREYIEAFANDYLAVNPR